MGEKKIKVLVADDETDFRQLLAFWLESRGYEVIAVSNGEEAVQTAQKENPDIVLTDLRMPVVDGVEAIRMIRRFNREVPIIVISAYVDDPKAKEAMAYGVSGVFYKGKDFQEGLSLLDSALRTHKKLKK
ncbi:MAG: response regulator [Candidatus Omnitrophota bacterium]